MDSKDWVKVYKAEDSKTPEEICHVWTGHHGDPIWLRKDRMVRIELMQILWQTESTVSGPERGPVFIDEEDRWYVPAFYFHQNYDAVKDFVQDVFRQDRRVRR